MGYYTKYFSTLFKGLRMTALKERIEVRRVINNLRRADNILYKKLLQDVQKDHRVTQAVNEEKRLLRELRKSADNCYYLMFNISTEDMQLLKAVGDILKELEAFSKSIGTANPQLRKVEREFALAILQALKKGESEDREEFKQVMLIINEAEEKDRNKFMANIRLAFQEERSQTMLAKFAARMEIRRAKSDILRLKNLPSRIKHLANKVARSIKPHLVVSELAQFISQIKKDCNDAFLELFYIRKRTVLLTLKILLDLNNLRSFNERWRKEHFMPEQPVKLKEEEINKSEEEISKHFHTIAQAFRIEINMVQSLEKEARIDASQM